MRFWQRLRYIEREREAALLLGLTLALQRTHSRVTPLAEERKRRATRRAADAQR